MPREDAIRWDARYISDKRHATRRGPRSFLVKNAGCLPGSGLALDVAMGLGDNAGFLLERGLDVVGVDISSVAVRRAKGRWPELMAVVADLTHFHLPPLTFDVILNFYYLQRELWPVYRRALRPGGILIMEALTQEMLSLKPATDPKHFLEPGELRQAFVDWQVLDYREGWLETGDEHRRAVASLVAHVPD